MGKLCICITLFFVLCCLSGCSINSIAAGYLQSTVAEGQTFFQSNPNFYLFERAMPTFIVMLDLAIVKQPDDVALLVQGAKLHTFYGLSFAEAQNNEWARLHYAQAKKYMEKVWQIKYTIDIAKISFQDLQKKIAGLPRKDVAELFWLAMSWGSYINTNRAETSAVVAVPFVEVLMQRVMQLDENYEHAMPHLFLGAFYSTSPSAGNKETAREHFVKALALTGGQMYLVHVTYARTFACVFKDKKLFEELLQQVFQGWENRDRQTFAAEYTLSNAMAYQQARLLLDKTEDMFPSFESVVEENGKKD
jgi:hypothetical protein